MLPRGPMRPNAILDVDAGLIQGISPGINPASVPATNRLRRITGTYLAATLPGLEIPRRPNPLRPFNQNVIGTLLEQTPVPEAQTR